MKKIIAKLYKGRNLYQDKNGIFTKSYLKRNGKRVVVKNYK